MSSWYPQLTKLRAQGWHVAVHNDYDIVIAGTKVTHTFWLLTHPSGVYVKGEGPTDESAILSCLRKVGELETL